MNKTFLSVCENTFVRIRILSAFVFLTITAIVINKPPIDPAANRADYIRILDIGSVVSVQLSNIPFASPAVRIYQTSDGNIAVLSTVEDSSHTSIQLTKVSLEGNILWTHRYQDSISNLVANDLTLSPDGGFLITSTRLGKSYQAWVLAVDNNGDSLWFKQYKTGFVGGAPTSPSLIVPDGTGNFLICGVYQNSQNDVYGPLLFLIDQKGNLINQKNDTIAQISPAEVKNPLSSNAVTTIKDGGFLLIGSDPSGNISTPEFYRIQINNLAHTSGVAWPQQYVRTFHGITIGTSNNFILFGDSTVNNNNGKLQSAVIYSVPDDGAYLPTWVDYYPDSTDNNTLGDHNSFTSGIHTSDNGYLAVGYSVIRSDTSIFIAKIDGAGKKIWAKIYPGFGGDLATSVLQASDGTYIVAGTTTSFGGRGGTNQVFIMRLNTNGDYVN